MGKRTKYKIRSDGRRETTKSYHNFGLSGFTGKKHFYGQTDEDIDRKIAEFEKQLNEAPPSRSFSSVIDDWWEDKRKKLSPNSISSYQAKKEEIRSRFGDDPVDEITAAQILAWLNTVAAQGYSQRGVSDRKSVMKNILDYALAHEEVTVNPCANLPIVKGAARQKRSPASGSDIDLLEQHKADSLLARMYYFMEYTGCRIGECIVLQQKDIDRENHKAYIHKDIAFEGNVPLVKDRPKTAAGNREVDLYDNVLEILPVYPDPDTYIFFPRGLPHKSALQKQQKKFRESIGISSTAHQLRHTYAGIMHSAEIDVKDTQARMGHANISVTQDIYTEIERAHNEKARNKANAYILNERLGRNKKKCPRCGSTYLKAEDGHEFRFCPDCGTELPESKSSKKSSKAPNHQ